MGETEIYFHAFHMQGIIFPREKPCVRIIRNADCKAVFYEDPGQAPVHWHNPLSAVFCFFDGKYPAVRIEVFSLQTHCFRYP